MTGPRVIPILNVSDVVASIAWFEALGWHRTFCRNEGGDIPDGRTNNDHGPADFGGVRSGESEIFLCRGAQGSRPGHIPADICSDETGGVWLFWGMDSVSAVDALYACASALAYIIPMKPCNEPWGTREFHLRHPDGHTIRVAAGLTAE
jgi:uncharacterized glyoxalase superfamily protein PhnB